jgi:hypothetical protein
VSARGGALQLLRRLRDWTETMSLPRTKRFTRRITGVTNRTARVAWLFILVAAACASTPPGEPLSMTELSGPVPATEQERAQGVGELNATAGGGARSATYGPWRVLGPSVDLTYVGENTWAGQLGQREVRLVASPGKLNGAGVNLHFFKTGEEVTVRGTFAQREIKLTMTPKSLRGKMASGAPGFEIKRDAPDRWSGTWGPGGQIFMTVRGEPVQYPKVLTPQFYLALLGILL